MIMSRALDRAESVLDADSADGGAVTSTPNVAFFRQPLAPILTAVGVTILVVLAISFARTNGLVAALWGAGGLAMAVWLRGGRGLTYDLVFGVLVTTGVLAGEFLVGNGPALSVMFTVMNLLEIGLAVVLARRFVPGLSVNSVEGLMRFLGVCAIAALPSAVLWLFAPGAAARTHLQAEAVRLGIARERLFFADHVPQDQHLARIALADLFLDTAPYNAHTTASDALWAGVPVLTCPGQTFPARVAASILTAAGLPQLIARDLDQYRGLALYWARQPNELRDLGLKLVATRDRTPLFDTQGYSRDLEELYIRMWRRLQAGQPPATLAPLGTREPLAGDRA